MPTKARQSQFSQQLDLVYSQALSIALVIPLVGIFTTLVFWNEDNRLRLSIWLTAIFAVALIRYLLLISYRRDNDKQSHIKSWYSRYLTLEIVSGLIWAALVVFIFPTDNAQDQLYMMVILAMMAAGASSNLAPVLSIYFGFLFSASIPAFIYLLLTSNLYWQHLEYLTLLYIAAMVIASLHINKRYKQAVQVLTHNQILLEQIQKTQSLLKEKNIALEKEIAYRLDVENDIRDEKQRFKALAEASNEGIIIYDANDHKSIIDHNKQAVDILDIGDASMIGKNICDVLHDFELDICDKSDEISFSHIVDNETRFYEGKIRTLPFRGNHHNVMTFIDITDRKQIDSLKNELISTISHELRTPLTSIHASLGLILGGLGGELDSNLKQLITIAYGNSDRLNTLINDILDIHKIQEGHMEYVMNPISVHDLLKDAITLNRPFGEKYHVSFNLEVDDRPCCINIDKKRIHQVLNNLLSNAAKFSPKQSDVLVKQTQLDGRCRISIIDYGKGIPEAFLPYLFHRFRQADSSDSRHHSGSGLGLSIVKKLVEGMHGNISVQSKEGQGTQFDIEFPSFPCQ